MKKYFAIALLLICGCMSIQAKKADQLQIMYDAYDALYDKISDTDSPEARIKMLSDFIKKYPTFADAYSDRAQIYASQLQPDNAIADLKKYVELTRDEAINKKCDFCDSASLLDIYANSLIDLGEYYKQLKRYKEAEDAFKLAIEVKSPVGAFISLGNTYAAQDKFDDALTITEMGLEQQREDEMTDTDDIFSTLDTLTTYAIKAGDYDRALKYVKEMRKITEDHPDALYAEYRVEAARGNYDKAAELLAKANETNEMMYPAMLPGADNAKVYQALRKVFGPQLTPVKADDEDYYKRMSQIESMGWEAFNLGLYDDVEQYLALVDPKERNYALHELNFYVQLMKENYDAAEAECDYLYDEFKSQDSDMPDELAAMAGNTNMNLASIYMSRGRLDDARKRIDILESIQKNSGRAQRALMEMDGGNLQKAIDLYKEEVADNYPSADPIYTNQRIGALYTLMGNAKEGKPYLEKAVELNKMGINDQAAALALGLLGRQKEAREIEDQQLATLSDSSTNKWQVYFFLTVLNNLMGDQEKALDYFDKALANGYRPDNFHMLHTPELQTLRPRPEFDALLKKYSAK